VKLHRYGLRFDDPRPEPYKLRLGCGVTAFDLDDAVALLEQQVFGGPLPFPISQTTEDVDVRTLDQGHVIPNMRPPDRRGVWYPIGYESSSRR